MRILKQTFFSGIIVAAALFPFVPARAITDSGVTFGPYVQRVTKTAATVFIRTDAANKLKCFYRKIGAENWKKIADSSDKTTHRYRIADLKKGNDYEYYIGTSDTHWTQTYTLHTKREVTVENPLRVAVVGDYGSMTTDQLRVVTQMMYWKPDIMLTTGDNAYDSGTLDEFALNVFKSYQALFAEVAVYPTLGNHDVVTEDGAPYKDVFELPVKRSGNEDYYSFKYDMVRFISLDSNSDYSEGSTQYTWLENELQDTNERWIIVYFHHPPFSSGEHGSTIAVQTSLVPLFEQYDVDLVLSGHDHDYERNAKVNGVRYIVTGGGGRSLYDQLNENPYSKVFEAEYHFVGLVIDHDELKLKAIDKRGYVFDSVTINK